MPELVSLLIQSLTLIVVAYYTALTRELVKSADTSAGSASKAVEDARLARIEEAAPHVLVFFDPNPHTSHFLQFVIRNAGKTPAYDVKLTFDPKLENSGEVNIDDLSVLQEGVHMLPPGYELKTIFDLSRKYYSRDDLPLRYRVDVRYRMTGQSGVRCEEQVLDLQALKGLMQLDRNDLHDVHSQLQQLGKYTEDVAHKLGRLVDTAETGVTIQNPSLTVDLVDGAGPDLRHLEAKLRQFKTSWAIAAAEDRVVAARWLPLQSYCRSAALAISMHAAAAPSSKAAEVAAALHQMADSRWVFDGGHTLRQFTERGRRVCELIDETLEELHPPKVKKPAIPIGPWP